MVVTTSTGSPLSRVGLYSHCFTASCAACTKSGLLTSPRLARVFGTDEDEGEGASFAIEFTTKDLFTLEKWNNEESYSIHAPLIEKFRDKIVGFSTILQTIEY